MAEVFLGIDIGTSSSKGVLVKEDGEIVARATRAHDTATPHPGWFEHVRPARLRLGTRLGVGRRAGRPAA